MKLSKDFKCDTNVQIFEKYNHHFKEYTEKQEGDDLDSQLEDSLRFFKLCLETLEKFEATSYEIVNTFENYAKQTSQMLYGIKEVNTFYSQRYNSKEISLLIREECTNPYKILLDWAEAEILDIRAIILAIMKRQELVKSRVRAVERLEEERKKLVKAQNGKKNWLTKQTKEQKVEKAEAMIEEAQREMDLIKFIEHIVNIKLAYIDIPMLKQNKGEKYEEILKSFINSSVEEFESLINQARQIDFLYTFTN